jgi:hypothetical protein
MLYFYILLIILLLQLSQFYSDTNEKDNLPVFDENNDIDNDFISWYLENGGNFHHIGIGHTLMGRGVRAIKPLQDGARVLSIPPHLMITVDTILKSTHFTHKNLVRMVSHVLTQARHRSNSGGEDVLIALFLLMEQEKEDASFWAPYLRILPEFVPNLSYLNENDYNELEDVIFRKEVFNQNSEYNVTYSLLEPSLETLWRSTFNISAPSFGHYLWALSIVNSRGLRFHGRIHLAPFADMFNYSPHPVLRGSDKGNFFLEHHKKLDDGSLEVYADRHVAENTELFMDYGDNSDNIYTQYHGFVPFSNPFRCLDIRVPPIPDDYPTKLRDIKSEIIRHAALKYMPSACIGQIPTKDSNTLQFQLPDVLITYISIMAMNEVEANTCLKSVNSLHIDDYIEHSARGTSKVLPRSIRNACGIVETENILNQLLDNVANGVPQGSSKGGITSKNDNNDDSRIPFKLQTFREAKCWNDDTSRRSKDRVTNIHTTLRGLIIDSLGQTKKTRVEEDFKNFKKSFDDAKLAEDVARALAQQHSAVRKDGFVSLAKSYGYTGESFESYLLTHEFASYDGYDVTTGAWQDDITTQEKLDLFNKWYNEASDKNKAVNKIEAALIPGYRIGTIATQRITNTSTYLEVPQEVILDSDAAMSKESGVRVLIAALRQKYQRADGFMELLFFLIHERLIKKENSYYWPYLRLLPSPSDQVDSPTAWTPTNQHLSELNKYDSNLGKSISYYIDRQIRNYNAIMNVPEVKDFYQALPGLLTFEHFRWAASILDSRSIWWNGQRHLVPMLDFVNCQEGPDPNCVHSTTMDATQTKAVTKSCWEFQQGEQVFENYGQPNHIYFQYHGFALKDNTHNCVNIDLDLTVDEATRLMWHHPDIRKISHDLRIFDKYRSLDQDKQIILPPPIEALQSTVCIPPSGVITPETWLHLALKTNTVLGGVRSKTLGRPERTALTVLLNQLETQIKLYNTNGDVETNPLLSHGGMKVYLSTSLEVLENVVKVYRDMLTQDDLPEIEMDDVAPADGEL